MQRYVLDKLADPTLRVYVVWGPMLEKETKEDVPAATAFLPDRRATHYWTPVHTLAEAFEKPLGLKGTRAWDTYLLYPRGQQWGGEPPVPAYVMHVGKPLPADHRLNGEKLEAETRKLVAAP